MKILCANSNTSKCTAKEGITCKMTGSNCVFQIIQNQTTNEQKTNSGTIESAAKNE